MSALRAEWTKLRTVRSSWWALGLALALTVLMSAFIASTVGTEGRAPQDPGEDTLMLSLGGVLFGQFAIVALAVVAITTEHATGTIRATFAANPRRHAVLAAKAAIVAGTVLLVGVAGSLLAFLATQPILHDNGFVAFNGYDPLSLTDGQSLRAVGGSGLYLALLALLSLGVGAILRHTAAAVTTVLALMFVPLIAAGMLPQSAQDTIQSIAPMTAGICIQTMPGHGAPLSPGAGIAVLAAWAGAALLGGLWLIGRRDA
jgi:ABC-2 type transport system permease protein